MSDKKSIQEALNEMKRIQEEKFLDEVYTYLMSEGFDVNEIDDEVLEAAIPGLGAALKTGRKGAEYVGHKAIDFGNYLKGAFTGRGSSTITTPSGRTIRQVNPKQPSTNVPAATVTAPKSSGLKDFGKAAVGAGAAAAGGYGAYKGYEALTKDKEPAGPSTDKSTKDEPKAAETPKPAETKMTFGQAYAKAREAAKAAGKDPNIAQFKFDRGGGEKVYQAAATKKDYVPMSKQFKVDIGSTKAAETPKPETPKTPVGIVPQSVGGSPTPKIPAETPKAPAAPQGFTKEPTVGLPTDRFTKQETESGKRKKMSEENDINEAIPMPPRRPGQTGGSMIQRGDTLSSLSKRSGLSVADIMKQNPSIKDPNKIRAGASINLQKPEAPKPTTWKDPVSAGYDKPAQTSPAPSTTAKSWDSDIPRIDKGPTTSTTTVSAPKPVSTTTVTPSSDNKPIGPNPSKFSTEDGGKRKKMSEENNPLIAAFLDLQAKNPANMFEAAKKAKKDYDKDGKIESPKDEVWGSRFRAAKAAGKMEEGMIDPNDPSVQGGSDVTSTPAKKVSMPKPTAPKTDSSVQGSGDVTKNGKPTRVKEEIEFSQAEIDHINSFFLEASVAPNRPEVAIGADSTSDKMSQNDVTGTSTESGKRKVKEEVEIDEAMGASRNPAVAYGVRKTTPKNYEPAAGGKTYRGGIDKNVSPWMSKDPEVKLAWIKKRKAENEAKANLPEETIDEAGYGNTPSVRSWGSDTLAGGYGRPRTPVATKGERKGMVRKSDQDSMKRRIADRLGKHTKANLPENIEQIEEGRPKKNPTPETTERDPRKHIQVEAGRAAAGNVVDFHHNDGSKSKITPAMGRRIVSHLQSLKPADRQAAVNKMHDSAEGLKV